MRIIIRISLTLAITAGLANAEFMVQWGAPDHVSFVGIYDEAMRTNGAAFAGINVRYFGVQGKAIPSEASIFRFQ